MRVSLEVELFLSQRPAAPSFGIASRRLQAFSLITVNDYQEHYSSKGFTVRLLITVC